MTKRSELFNDVPHQGRLGSLLQDCCAFAALYHKPPAGLELKLDMGIAPDQSAARQKIAWGRCPSTRPRASRTNRAKRSETGEFILFSEIWTRDFEPLG